MRLVRDMRMDWYQLSALAAIEPGSNVSMTVLDSAKGQAGEAAQPLPVPHFCGVEKSSGAGDVMSR